MVQPDYSDLSLDLTVDYPRDADNVEWPERPRADFCDDGYEPPSPGQPSRLTRPWRKLRAVWVMRRIRSRRAAAQLDCRHLRHGLRVVEVGGSGSSGNSGKSTVASLVARVYADSFPGERTAIMSADQGNRGLAVRMQVESSARLATFLDGIRGAADARQWTASDIGALTEHHGSLSIMVTNHRPVTPANLQAGVDVWQQFGDTLFIDLGEGNYAEVNRYSRQLATVTVLVSRVDCSRLWDAAETVAALHAEFPDRKVILVLNTVRNKHLTYGNRLDYDPRLAPLRHPNVTWTWLPFSRDLVEDPLTGEIAYERLGRTTRRRLESIAGAIRSQLVETDPLELS